MMSQVEKTSSAGKSVSGLGVGQKLSYALPIAPLHLLIGPIAVIQGIYATWFGVSMAAIAGILLISRIFDAVTDPIIGIVSDRQVRRGGSRKPLIVLGGAILLIGAYFLFVPIGTELPDGSLRVHPAYFLVCYLFYYLGWTMVEIPHLAWGSDIAPDGRDKTMLYSIRAGAMYIGNILFYIIPFLPFLDDTNITPETLKWAMVCVVPIMVFSLFSAVRYVPNGTVASGGHHETQSFWALRHELSSNRPFLIYVAAFSVFSIGGASFLGLMFIWVDAYLQQGANFAAVTLLALVLSLISLRGWSFLVNHFGKKQVWAVGAGIYALGLTGATFLGPGDPLFLLTVVLTMLYVSSVATNITDPSILSEIVDYGHLKFGANRAGVYFSFMALLKKTLAALGVAMGFGFAGFFGFDPSAEAHTINAVNGLKLAAFWLPALLMFVGGLIVLLIPINNRRHAIIRRRLNQRAMREASNSLSDDAE